MTPLKFPEANITLAKDQPQYLQLPAHVVVTEPEARMITLWNLSWRERIKLLLLGRLWLTQMTFGHPFQPILPQVDSPFIASPPSTPRDKSADTQKSNPIPQQPGTTST